MDANSHHVSLNGYKRPKPLLADRWLCCFAEIQFLDYMAIECENLFKKHCDLVGHFGRITFNSYVFDLPVFQWLVFPVHLEHGWPYQSQLGSSVTMGNNRQKEDSEATKNFQLVNAWRIKRWFCSYCKYLIGDPSDNKYLRLNVWNSSKFIFACW